MESYLILITPGDKDISNKCSSPTLVEVDISVQKLIWNPTKVFNMPTEASREHYFLIQVENACWSFLQNGLVPRNKHFQGLRSNIPRAEPAGLPLGSNSIQENQGRAGSSPLYPPSHTYSSFKFIWNIFRKMQVILSLILSCKRKLVFILLDKTGWGPPQWLASSPQHQMQWVNPFLQLCEECAHVKPEKEIP